MAHDSDTHAAGGATATGASRKTSIDGGAFGTGSVRSADGTTIGYRRLGAGPSLILVHGGMMASQNLTRLGAALSPTFTVYIPDRRGRGLSGPFGDDYGIDKERQDLEALMGDSGAERVFGLSSGAIISLHAALTLPIQKLALYEPPLLIPGSSHLGWVPRYERELAAGKLASAMVTVIRGTGDPSALAAVPRFLLASLLHSAINADAKDAKGGRVPIGDLIPTMHFDVKLVTDAEGALARAGAVRADVLLLGGSKSAPYLRHALDELGKMMPNAERIELSGVGHLAADNGGKPDLVADRLRAFFG